MNVSVSSFISIATFVKGILLERIERSTLATQNVGTVSTFQVVTEDEKKN